MGKPRRQAVQRDLLPDPYPETRVIPTRQYRESLAELPANVQQVIKRKVHLLQRDRAHPGLNVHRMIREPDVWSCYTSRVHRVLFRVEHTEAEGETLYLLDVGRHDINPR